MQITGQVTQVLPIEQGTSKAGKSWQKQTFVITVEEGGRDNQVPLTLWGDKCSDVPGVGATVTVDFDINGREYNGRWYVELKAWRVTAQQQAVQQAPAPQPQQQQLFPGTQWQTVAQAQANGTAPQPVKGNDLPF